MANSLGCDERVTSVLFIAGIKTILLYDFAKLTKSLKLEEPREMKTKIRNTS